MSELMTPTNNTNLSLDPDELSYCTQVQEISQRRFIEMHEVLPPLQWHVAEMTESFKCCELYYGRVTSIFVRIGKYAPRFFTFRHHFATPHATAVSRLIESLAAEHFPAAGSEASSVAAISPDFRWGVRPEQLKSMFDTCEKLASFQPINGSGMFMLDRAAMQQAGLPQEAMAEIVKITQEHLLVCEEAVPVPTASKMLRLVLQRTTADMQERDWVRKHAIMFSEALPGAEQFVVEVDDELHSAPERVRDLLLQAKSLGAALAIFHIA